MYKTTIVHFIYKNIIPKNPLQTTEKKPVAATGNTKPIWTQPHNLSLSHRNTLRKNLPNNNPSKSKIQCVTFLNGALATAAILFMSTVLGVFASGRAAVALSLSGCWMLFRLLMSWTEDCLARRSRVIVASRLGAAASSATSGKEGEDIVKRVIFADNLCGWHFWRLWKEMIKRTILIVILPLTWFRYLQIKIGILELFYTLSFFFVKDFLLIKLWKPHMCLNYYFLTGALKSGKNQPRQHVINYCITVISVKKVFFWNRQEK